MPNILKIAVPSWGRHLHNASINLLKRAGYSFDLSDKRRYAFNCETTKGMQLILRVTKDIPDFVARGSIDLGITGRDWVDELKVEEENRVVELLKLGFGKCRISIAIPEEWTDVDTIVDLYIKAKRSKSPLRVATEFEILAKEFLRSKGLTNVEIIRSAGSTESLKGLEADIIVDVVSTTHTLQANRLKELVSILDSEAVLIANTESYKNDSLKTKILELVDNFESAMLAGKKYMVLANLIAEGPEEIIDRLKKVEELKGLAGPTISPVYVINPTFEKTYKNNLSMIEKKGHGKRKIWAVNLVVDSEDRFKAIEGLRRIGGSGIFVFKPDFVYEGKIQ